jgi:hypothetical protein
MATSTTTTTESRALTLLGQGVPPSAVANALGVDVSRISQLLSDEEFSSKVVEKKFEALSKHNERDGVIDGIEDRVLKKLDDSLAFMTRPMEILKTFQIINAAKRKGQTAPESLTSKQTIIQLNIPSIILQKFQTNTHNQVVQVGQQSLLTIQSGQMLKQLEQHQANQLLEAQNVSTGIESIPNIATTETGRYEQTSSQKDFGISAGLSVS